MIHRVKATREGLVGKTIATGLVIADDSWFVALPSRRALRKTVNLWPDDHGVPHGEGIKAPVLDVGPWNTSDDNYVFENHRPLSEIGVSVSGHGTNGAGIDLSNAVFYALGMKDNGYIWWEFV